MKTVYSASSISIVSIFQNILAGYGIRCWIKNEFFAGIGEIDLATTQRYIHRLKKENREVLVALPGLTDSGKSRSRKFSEYKTVSK